MATKRPRRPRDANVLAKLIVDMATGEAPRDPESAPMTPATEARRKGGLRGGKARARKLSAKRRRDMQMRRFTRLTNAFSKKVENHAAAISLHFMHYNFARIHKTLRVTPAMEAGVSDHVWSLAEIVGLLDTPPAARSN
jgi:hypothetical protein